MGRGRDDDFARYPVLCFVCPGVELVDARETPSKIGGNDKVCSPEGGALRGRCDEGEGEDDGEEKRVGRELDSTEEVARMSLKLK